MSDGAGRAITGMATLAARGEDDADALRVMLALPPASSHAMAPKRRPARANAERSRGDKSYNGSVATASRC
jgi:hypothetical protein